MHQVVDSIMVSCRPDQHLHVRIALRVATSIFTLAPPAGQQSYAAYRLRLEVDTYCVSVRGPV